MWTARTTSWVAGPATSSDPTGRASYDCRACGINFRDPELGGTFDEIKAELAGLNITLARTADGSYDVDVQGSEAEHGYLTADLDDAYLTGLHMAERRWLSWAAQYGYDN